MNRKTLIVAVTVPAIGQAAHAGVVDVTKPNAFGTINGAIFSTMPQHAAGAGTINPFLRVRADGVQAGYNTSARPLGGNEVADDATHDLRLRDIATVSVGGVDYLQFFLDIDEASRGPGAMLSLDDLRIYTSGTAHSDYQSELSRLGTLRYSMDQGADSRVDINSDLTRLVRESGDDRGRGDMALLLPASFFTGADQDSFVYLYSSFGVHHGSGGGFEEWWTRFRSASIIALPGAGALAGMGVLSCVVMLGRRRAAREQPSD